MKRWLLDTLSRLQTTYLAWCPHHQSQIGQPLTEIELLNFSLGSLLRVAGSGHVDEGFAMFCDYFLKPQFTSKEAARTVLASALSTGSVSDFRRSILSCIPDHFLVFPKTEDFAHLLREWSKNCLLPATKSFARTHFASAMDREQVFSCCNPNCKARPIKVFYCKCRTVCYCNKDCQLEHWRDHKRVCSESKTNRAKKKQQGSPQS